MLCNLQKGVGLRSVLLVMLQLLRVVGGPVGPVSEEQPAHWSQSLEKDGLTSGTPGDRAEQPPPNTPPLVSRQGPL